MIDTTHHNLDSSRPLANLRHEQFAQAYAGDAWGNAAEAYRRAGYRPKTPHGAAVCGLRLLTNVDILARIKMLRAGIEERLHIDRLCLATERWDIARDKSAAVGERLAAMRDLEKAMGWQEPEKANIEVGGLAEILAVIDGKSRGIPTP